MSKDYQVKIEIGDKEIIYEFVASSEEKALRNVKRLINNGKTAGAKVIWLKVEVEDELVEVKIDEV